MTKERETVLVCAIDFGDPLEDTSDIHGVAIDVEDDEWKVVEFSGYECSWAQRYECTDNFSVFYAKYKADIKRVGYEISSDEIAELFLDEARQMASRMVERHAEMLAEEARRAAERRAAEEARRAKEEELRRQQASTIGDEYDEEMLAKLRVAFDSSVGNDSKRCVPALLKIDDVYSVTREERNSLLGYANDITILVQKSGEPFPRTYYISWPGAIFRSA